MDVLYLLHLLIFAHAVSSSITQYCQEAVDTVKHVSSCPTTQEDRDNAARKKNCEKYSQQQNCSKATNFRYHCVINEHESELLEVCAPTRFILGFCTEFNVQGGRIQDHYSAECSEFDQPCSKRYISTDAYLYESCYDLVGNHKTSERPYLANMTSTIIGSNNETSTQGDSADSILIWLLPVVGSFILILVIAVVLIYRRRNSRLQKVRGQLYKDLHSRDEELPLNQERAQDDEISKRSNTDKATSSRGKAQDDEISKRSFTDIATYNRGKSLMAMFKKESGTEKNKQYNKTFLDEFRKFDEYFFETQIFKKAKEYIDKYRFAILIGPPGNGKTNTAIHLMLDPRFASWTMRKVNRLSELALIDHKENTFVLIDNIFDGLMYDEEVGKWLDSLVYKLRFDLSKQKNVQVLITAKDDVIETISNYMDRKSDLFDRKYVIDVNNAQLTDSEKLDIFDNQISFANKVLGIEKPARNEKFRKEIVNARGPIGFPLCAHLYACAEINRRMGSSFFSHPMNYLRDLVKHEIEEDRTPKTKTLLLLLYLSESRPKDSSPDIMNLSNDKMCKQSLEKFSIDDKEFDTSGLTAQAEKLIPTILRRPKPDSFCFKHQTICNAVGNYFFGEHFKMALEAFPIETFVDQDFSTVTEQQCSEICVRLIDEVVDHSNVEKVFSCIALKESSFAQTFCGHLDAKDIPFLRVFFAATGTHSCQFKFPGTFWVSKNKCFHLAMLLTEMIRIKDIDTDLHFYASLFGDCCASDESLLRKANPTTLEDVEKAKDAVQECKTYEGHTIFHIVAMTSKSDLHSFHALKKLHADFQDRKPEMYSKRNERGETPLNLAAKNRNVSRILSLLAFLEFDETCTNTKDVDGNYPIYNTIFALESRIDNALVELEMTVRMCIFILYGANSDHKTQAKSFRNKDHLFEMLDCEPKKQNEMTSIIGKLLAQIGKVNREGAKLPNPNNGTKLPNPNNRIGDSLLNVIQNSVSLLKEAKFEI